jgi:two-component system LytT family response regulator
MKTAKYQTLIIDDEQDSREFIALLLRDMFPEIEIAGMGDDLKSASRLLSAEKADLVFLDIEMPDGKGIELLEKGPGTDAVVIFITAYDKYAIRALRAAAFDYILKPVNSGEFRDAVTRALRKIDLERETKKRSVVLPPLERPRKIGIPNLNGFDFVDIDSIIRCEAEDNYTRIFFTTQNNILVSRSLAHFEAELESYGFIRIHHKHLVNLKQVSSYSKGKGGGSISMSDNAVLEVSVRRKADLIRMLDPRS